MKDIRIEISYRAWLVRIVRMPEENLTHGELHSLVVEKDLATKTFSAYGKYQKLYSEPSKPVEYVTLPVEVPKELIGAINEKNLLGLNEVEEVAQLDGGTYHVDICIDGETAAYHWNDSEMETTRLLKLLGRWYDKLATT